MIEVRFSGQSMDEILELTRQFVASKIQPVIHANESKPVEKAKAEPKPAEPAKTPETAPTEAAPAVNPGYKEIADYVPKAVSKYGRGKIATLLEGFGAKTGKDLKIEQYPEVMAKLKAEYPL